MRHGDQFLGFAVAILLSYRSLSRPSLRPAAWAVAAFCALDAARLAGLPPFADVVVFVVMPACWGALLKNRGPETEAPSPLPVSGCAPPWLARKNVVTGQCSAKPEFYCRGAATCFLPAIVYALSVLLLRHPLARAGLWQGALALPRVVVGAWALWVGMRAGRAVGEERGLPPSRAIGIILALGVGACVVGGLWGDWGGVRIMSGASWALVAVVALRAPRA